MDASGDDTQPDIVVRDGEADSGKTTLANEIGFLVRNGLPNVEISGPALFRSIRKWSPCFIVDEADNVFDKNADLRSVVNSGWTRGSGVVRCHPTTNEPEMFSAFTPKLIAMKGRKLPDTTLSRSIIYHHEAAAGRIADGTDRRLRSHRQ